MALKIAIAGAGIGGMAASVLAAAKGHDVALFEKFGTPRPLGSGLVIQPVGLAVLDRIGAGDEARLLGRLIRRMVGHEARRGKEVLRVAYRDTAPGLAIHRASLFHVLWTAVGRSGLPVVTSAEVVDAPADGTGRRLILADGRDFGPFDLIVDASGANSPLSLMRARSLPYGALWGTVPWPHGTELPDSELRQRYDGARRMVGILPLGRMPGGSVDMTAVFWSLPVTGIALWRGTPLAEWQQEAVILWPEIAPFLDAIIDHDAMTVARYSHGTLRRPFGQAIVHIGDSAHRASPQLGQGANMALLDALALSAALVAPLDKALPAYAAMRRWHIRTYQGMSAVFTPMYQSENRYLPVIRDHILAPAARLPGIRHILTRLVSGDMLPPLAGRPFP